MKTKLLNFSLGFFSCLVLCLLISKVVITTEAAPAYNALQSSSSVFVGNKKVPVEAVNINNKTYLPLRQLGDLVNVKINWNQDNNRIDITPSSQLIVRQIHGKKYVDVTYWYDRYYTNLEAYFPYRFDFDALSYWQKGTDRFDGSKDLFLGGLDAQSTKDGAFLYDYDFFIKNIWPMMPLIIESNEKALNSK